MGKRGPKKQTGIRETGGRLSRKPIEKQARDASKIAAEEWDAMNTALMARLRVHGVPMDKLRDQMAGSYIGRLCLCGEITHQQFDAAQAYLADRRDYHMAIDAPKQMGAVDLNAVHGRNHHENVKRSQQSVAKFMGKDNDGKTGVRGAILDAQTHLGNTSNLWAALDLCVHNDLELRHMVGDLRLLLNALARHYGLDSRRAA